MISYNPNIFILNKQQLNHDINYQAQALKKLKL